jgi:Cof subfamily protein (haloacid dehalogenase superfamily)
MRFRAVCTDIDGTLLDIRRELSPATISAIKKIAPSTPVILASSRMPAAMTHLQHELGIAQYPLICYNGGYVISYGNGSNGVHVFDSVVISLDVCRSIIHIGKNTSIHMSLYYEDDWFAPARDQWTEREEKITKVRATIESPDHVLDRWQKDKSGAHKIMCMGPAEEVAEIHKLLNEKHGSDIHVYLSRPTYLELAPKSISKGSALKLILEKHFNIPVADAIAFGDNYNDLDMLQVAGLGIAVANARSEVKAIAGEVTAKSTQDGVALAIGRWFQTGADQ